jgi:hypothetical protein
MFAEVIIEILPQLSHQSVDRGVYFPGRALSSTNCVMPAIGWKATDLSCQAVRVFPYMIRPEGRPLLQYEAGIFISCQASG